MSKDGKHYSGSDMYEMVVVSASDEARKRRKSVDETASEIIKGKAYRKVKEVENEWKDLLLII